MTACLLGDAVQERDSLYPFINSVSHLTSGVAVDPQKRKRKCSVGVQDVCRYRVQKQTWQFTEMSKIVILLFWYIKPNKMHMSQSLFYLTTALHASGVTITHFQEYKTTVITASGNRYTVPLSPAIMEEFELISNSSTTAADNSTV